MEISFSSLKIYINEDEDVVICQPWMCEDDSVVVFPTHQAKAICKAILAVASHKG